MWGDELAGWSPAELAYLAGRTDDPGPGPVVEPVADPPPPPRRRRVWVERLWVSVVLVLLFGYFAALAALLLAVAVALARSL